jgi:hypothetical protein
VGVVPGGVPAEVEAEGGAIGGRALAEVVQHDPGRPSGTYQ